MVKNKPNLMISQLRRTVGLASVIICGTLHKELVVIYAYPGDWTSTPIRWCDDMEGAYAEVIARGYEVRTEN